MLKSKLYDRVCRERLAAFRCLPADQRLAAYTMHRQLLTELYLAGRAAAESRSRDRLDNPD